MALEDLFYPGSRQRRPEAPVPLSRARKDTAWADNPSHRKIRKVRGQDMEFFTISAFAAALDRSPVTIRKWIRDGVIPDAPYKTQPVPNTPEESGRRLWTRGYIEAVVEIAKGCGMFNKNQLTAEEMNKFSAQVFAWVKARTRV